MPGDLGPPERDRERTRRLKVPSRGGVVIVRASYVSEASVVEGGREPDQAPLASAREPRTAQVRPALPSCRRPSGRVLSISCSEDARCRPNELAERDGRSVRIRKGLCTSSSPSLYTLAPPQYPSCSATRCPMMSSSISLTSPPAPRSASAGIRSHSSPARCTKTTSCLRVSSRLPTTIWCPYRSSAPRAFGMRIAGSVSSCGRARERQWAQEEGRRARARGGAP